jgi:hypothetical protein
MTCFENLWILKTNVLLAKPALLMPDLQTLAVLAAARRPATASMRKVTHP